MGSKVRRFLVVPVAMFALLGASLPATAAAEVEEAFLISYAQISAGSSRSSTDPTCTVDGPGLPSFGFPDLLQPGAGPRYMSIAGSVASLLPSSFNSGVLDACLEVIGERDTRGPTCLDFSAAGTAEIIVPSTGTVYRLDDLQLSRHGADYPTVMLLSGTWRRQSGTGPFQAGSFLAELRTFVARGSDCSDWGSQGEAYLLAE